MPISGHSENSSWRAIKRLGESCCLTQQGCFHVLVLELCRRLYPRLRRDSPGAAAGSVSFNGDARGETPPTGSSPFTEHLRLSLISTQAKTILFFLKQNFHKSSFDISHILFLNLLFPLKKHQSAFCYQSAAVHVAVFNTCG